MNGSVLKNDDRHIDGIDGLRGLAIVGVTDFHIVERIYPVVIWGWSCFFC